jgi:serine/threonine-protein kinase
MSKDLGPSPKPETPSRIGKYTILGRIGQGAMGQVFRALDPVLNRHVAIKMMTADVSNDPQLSQRFLREAQSAAKLNHPNIVTMHDFGEDHGQFYMAMELLEGQDLSAVIKQQRLASLEDKLALMEQVCDGLAYAHSQEVIHRDLKPANLHVQSSGRVKIMDFGLARVAGSDMTTAGTIMGSPNYMSPEQVRGERVDSRSDVFSLGAVFYEMLSGRRAFEAEALHAILYKVANVEPDPLSLLMPDLPAIVVELVEKALQKEPASRFTDAVEMREALEVCRRVLDGSLDEETAMASLREARTILETAPAPASNEPGAAGPATISSIAVTRPAISRRTATGSLPVVRLGQASATPPSSVRTKVGSRPPRPMAAPPAAAPVQASQVSSVPSVPPASRAPVYVAVAASVAALAVALFLALRPRPPVTPPAGDPKAAALVTVAVEAQLDVARKSLEYKDLPGALAAAEKALRLDPGNAEAKTIQQRARQALEAVDAAVKEAREAARAGDTEKATQAVARVLAQVPDHPVAAELASQLNSRFQSRAEEALRQMRSAGQAAQRGGASSMREYAEAGRVGRDAQDLFQRKQYTEATQKALEAQKLFDLAKATAAELAAKAAATPSTTLPPATTLAAAPPTTLPPTAPPVTAPPPPTTLRAAGPSDDTLIRRALSEFARAIESKDIALYKTLRPSLSGDDERKLRAAFESIRSQEVELTVESVTIDGAQAVARAVRGGKVNGQAVPTRREVYRLSKGPSGWSIVDIGQ